LSFPTISKFRLNRRRQLSNESRILGLFVDGCLQRFGSSKVKFIVVLNTSNHSHGYWACTHPFLDHRGITLNRPPGALAHFGLARALSGDTAKARTAYHDFFALWKDAAPDIPILREAKAEYAGLQ
jgi:hypothetical protein